MDEAYCNILKNSPDLCFQLHFLDPKSTIGEFPGDFAIRLALIR